MLGVFQLGVREPFVACTLGLLAGMIGDTYSGVEFMQLVWRLFAGLWGWLLS